MAFTNGWVYNLKVENPPTNAPRLIAIVLAFPIIAVLAVALRFGVRLKTGRAIGPDDWWVVWSTLMSIGYSIVAVIQTRWGQALDPSAFPPENIIPFSKIQYAGGPLYTLALLGFKLSLLFSYLRFIGHQKTYRILIYSVIALCAVNQFIFTLVICLACHPVAKQWDATLPGHCINQVSSYYAIAGTSLGLDVLIVGLPIPILWKLNLNSMKQRIALICVFSMGLFVTVIQIIRVFTIANLKDYTDSNAIVSWSAVEINLGIVVASAPTYAPLLKYATEKLGSSRTKNKGYNDAEDRGYVGSNGGGTKTKDTSSKGRPSNHGFNFALDDIRSKSGASQITKSKIDVDNESQEEILKVEDGIRIATSITQTETERQNSTSAEYEYPSGRTSRAHAQHHGW